MSDLSDFRITDEDVAKSGVIAAPDRLTGTAAQNKAVFDRLIRDAVKEKYNAMLAAIGGLFTEGKNQLVWEPYDAKKAYVPWNKVVYNGSSYLCTKACTGVLPTDAAHWRLIAARGADGTGAGDMRVDIYDPRKIEADVFAYVDKRTDHMLTSNVTYYVDASAGNDVNDGRSAKAPLKTIMAAVNRIPKMLSGYTATINVASGSYMESLELIGFTSGVIRIKGPEATLASVFMRNSPINAVITCKSVVYNAIPGAPNYLIRGQDGGFLDVLGSNLLLDGGNHASIGVVSYNGTGIAISSTDSSAITVTNCATGISSSVGGHTHIASPINIQNCSSVGVAGHNGGFTTMASVPSFINTPTQYYVKTGGRVYVGAQTFVSNY